MSFKDRLNKMLLSIKVWGVIYIAALLIFIFLSLTSSRLVSTVENDIKQIKQQIYLTNRTFIELYIDDKITDIQTTLSSFKTLNPDQHPKYSLNNYLKNQVDNMPLLQNLLLVDKFGNATQLPTGTSPINVSDRYYFQFHQNNPHIDLHISEPFVGQILQEKIFVVTQRVENEIGEFNGIIIAAVTPTLFQDIESNLPNSGFSLAVKSIHSGGYYYGMIPDNPSPTDMSFFNIESTPFQFSFYDISTSTSSYENSVFLVNKMKHFYWVWAIFSVILISLSLFLFRRQVGISQQYMYESKHDYLTKIYNRSEFMAQFSREFKKYQRYGHSLSVITLDIDHFKKINDTYGHAAGDVVIKHIAKLLSNQCRETDICARIGGEEFALCLPHTDLQGAYIAAEKYRKTIEKTTISYGGKHISYTASFGVFDTHEASLVLEKNVTIDDLLNLADNQLYEAKQTRNCVVPDLS